MIRPARFFISAVTSEFGGVRDEIADFFYKYGHVDAQRSYPSDLSSGTAIQSAIDEADIVICLIGHKFGGGKFRGPNYPPGLDELCSWTQWEFAYAHDLFVRRAGSDKALFVLFDDTAPNPAGTGESAERAASQAAFRQRVREAGGPFRVMGSTFIQPARPENFLKLIEDRVLRSNGALRKLQQSFWMQTREQETKIVGKRWVARFGGTMPGVVPAETDRPRRYVDSRRFRILEPSASGAQLRALKPQAFLTGMDNEPEQQARREGNWRAIGSESVSPGETIAQFIKDGVSAIPEPADGVPAPVLPLALGPVTVPAPIRLFFVSGSGVGKTTTLQMLQARLCGWRNAGARSADGQPVTGLTALLFLAHEFSHLPASDILGGLIALIIERVRKGVLGEPDLALPENVWMRSALEYGIRKDLTEGRLCLIIDGLDHIPAERNRGIAAFLLAVEHGSWGRCPLILSGRPHALLEGWSDTGEDGLIDARMWRFVEPEEFERHEAEAFLGKDHFLKAKDNLGPLLGVPRLLECMLEIEPEDLSRLHSPADILDQAVRKLIERNIRGIDVPALGHVNSAVKGTIVHGLLAAIGFVTTCPTVDPLYPLDEEQFEIIITAERVERMRRRFALIPGAPPDLFNAYVELITRMAGFVGNGLLDPAGSHMVGNELAISWSNRTIQQFLAACWLSDYCGVEVIERYLAARDGRSFHGFVKEISDAGRADPQLLYDPCYDWVRLRHYVYLPDADYASRYRLKSPLLRRTDATKELNMFLAEMPRVAEFRPLRWVAVASAWYDPELFDCADEDGRSYSNVRTWPSEMLYRSWRTIHRIAGQTVDDWWDCSYQTLINRTPVRSAARVDRTQMLAKMILDAFRSDFPAILAGQHGEDNQATAKAMVDAAAWATVPAGTFAMGRPKGLKQGVATEKVENYWQVALIDEVASGRATPEAIAEKGTWPEWFAGAIGANMRRADIDWMANDVLRPLATAHADGWSEKRVEAAKKKAFKAIVDAFRSEDEKPASNPQDVAGFALGRYPVLNREYELFASGHRQYATLLLNDVGKTFETRKSDSPPEPIVSDADLQAMADRGDHPAVYLSWFDAWAFCQWVNWTEDGKRRGLRLPHEVEWEFATRWHRRGGEAAPSKPEWRWWWGDRFYADEKDATDLAPIPDDANFRRVMAHIDGRAGRTRPPEEAEPNGLGLYDTLGNVWEWMANPYSIEEATSSLCDPTPYDRTMPAADKRVPTVALRVMRGGLWYYFDILTTSANRFRYAGHDVDYRVGFRVVRTGAA